MEIKIFKIKKKFTKGGIHMNPSIYWNFIQGIAFLTIVGSFVFGFYLFTKINKEFISSAENTNKQADTISKERIDKALKYFSDRKNKSESILNSPSPIIDPSL